MRSVRPPTQQKTRPSATRGSRKSRYLKLWTDSDGAGHLEAKMTPDAFGIVKSGLEQIAKEIFEEARKEDRRESQRAYLVDALVQMAGGSGSCGTGEDSKSSRRRPLIRLRVDLPALLRGHRTKGEVCEIPGIDSPIPVATARALIGDAFLELFIAEGTDVRTVVTDTRHVARALQIALEERDSVCCVPGCSQSMGLERDHWETDFIKGGETSIANLAMLCPHHHDQKTYRGWRLVGPPGRWRFVGPEGEEPIRSPGGSDPAGTVRGRDRYSQKSGLGRGSAGGLLLVVLDDIGRPYVSLLRVLSELTLGPTLPQ